MSLFPAYSDEAKKLEEQTTSTKPDWLENSSFNPDIVIKESATVSGTPDKRSKISSGESSPESEPLKTTKRKKTKRRKKGKEKKKIEPEDIGSKDFSIDSSRVNEYLTVATISRPAVAKYRVKYYLTSSRKLRKQKFKRYFKVIKLRRIDESGSEDKEKLTKHNIDKADFSERDVNFTGFIQEEELSKMTGFYNKNTADNPDDIKMWLKYAEFQDTVYQFEKSYRKGSIAKALRVLAERKIAILDKALMHNPGCDALLRERLKVAVSAFPADELQAQLQKLVKKERENIILWQGYIEATQCSMSHCNTSSVISLYSECLSTLHQLRRTTMSEKYVFEENILKMLSQCGLFLKQAGLFEQLWTLLKMYLELNLSPLIKGKFNVERNFNEKELLELEEVVLNSQLPHHELWLRTEKLREACHWLPYSGDQECEDPQRMVFSEDVVELIHPITMPENIFKLVATILTLLKVPLLPCRHSTMQDLGLDYVSWSVDSIEALLSVFVPLYPVDTTNENLLKDTNRLAVGPQYLKALPGQEEYLHFVLSVIENCAECLKNQDQISVYMWWFRFQRLLIILDNQGRFKMPSYLKKKIKSDIKTLLKKAEHRNNEIFYVEYALIEKEFGNTEQCITILETALSMNKNASIETKSWDQEQVKQCYLYKTLVEAVLASNLPDAKETAQKYLVKLALQRNFNHLTNGLVLEAETRFRNITADLMETEIDNLSCLEHFLPNFFTDWIICNGWFIFLYKGPLECGTFLENVIEKLHDKHSSLAFQKEVLYEFYCAILFKYCLENPGSGVFKILDNVLFRSIENYPNNLYFLAILSKEMTLIKNMGTAWWKVQSLLLKSGRSITTIFSVIILDLIKLEIEKDVKDTITGDSVGISSFKNRMLSLYKKITKNDMCTRRCGLAWRLYLQFVHNFFDFTLCRNIYYSAVEECPWLKALYMDAAIYIPAELGQIQDLIIEKQLRLHVTPEELEILRS